MMLKMMTKQNVDNNDNDNDDYYNTDNDDNYVPGSSKAFLVTGKLNTFFLGRIPNFLKCPYCAFLT